MLPGITHAGVKHVPHFLALCLDHLRQVSIEEGDGKARECSVHFIETSAKAGLNIKVSVAFASTNTCVVACLFRWHRSFMCVMCSSSRVISALIFASYHTSQSQPCCSLQTPVCMTSQHRLMYIQYTTPASASVQASLCFLGNSQQLLTAAIHEFHVAWR